MAVNKPGNPNAPVNPQAQTSANPMSAALNKAGVTQPQQPNYQQQPQQLYGNKQSGIVGLNGKFKGLMSRNSSSEQVTRIERAMTEIIQNNVKEKDQQDIMLVTMDNNRHQVAFSTILLIYKNAVKKKATVFSYIVEASSSKLQNRYDTVNGTQIEIEVVTGDMYGSNSFWQQVVNIVESYTGIVASVKNSEGKEIPNIFDAGSIIIDNDADINNIELLHQLLFNGMSAAATVLAYNTGEEVPTFTVKDIGQGDNLFATVDFSGDQEKTVTGLPIRSDIKILLNGTANSGYENEIGITRQSALTTLSGYVDLVFEQPASQQQGYNNVPPQWAKRSYYPRFIITKASSCLDTETLEMQLLTLSTSILLSQNNTWAGAFKPRYVENDLRDIGAVGYEINFSDDPNQKPERINTKSDVFDHGKLRQLIDAAIFPNLIYSMDVEETGELGWVHKAFLAAAEGNARYTQDIINAANKLTNNAFSACWDSSSRICVSDGNRIHLGYYVDEKGEKRDIRDIDYLAVLNLIGKTNPSMIEEWEKTYTQTNEDICVRLDRRRKMLAALYSGKLEVKGFARRIIFSPAFIEALSQACLNAGLIIRPANNFEHYGAQHVRGQSGLSSFAVQGQAAASMFNASSAQTNASRYSVGPRFTRGNDNSY